MRLIELVKTSLASDKLALEEELERIVNNKSLETEIKLQKIKTILEKIATTDLCFKTFIDLMTNDEEQKAEQ